MNVILRINLAAYRVADVRKYKATVKGVLELYFEAITSANAVFLAMNPDVPNLYDTDVRYRRDPERDLVSELWLDAPGILGRGYDDCEGLSSYLAAELRMRKNNSVGARRYPGAAVWLKPTRVPGSWHAVVRDLETKQVWDPSKILGMGRKRAR